MACGAGIPPDWYIYQGVRVISHSAPRRIPLTLQSSAGGTYAAMPNSTNPSNYNVANKVSTLFDNNGTVSQSLTGPSEALNARQFGMGVAPGYDVTIGHYFCRDKNNNNHFVEFSFWGLNSWSKSKRIGGFLSPIYDQTFNYNQSQAMQINLAELIPVATGNYQGSLRTNFPIAGSTELPGATDAQKTLSLAFNYATEHSYLYRSVMNNFEINGRISPRNQPNRLVLHPDGRWRRECQPGTYMSYLYGVRLLAVNETFTFHSVGTGPYGNDSANAPQDAVGDIGVVTHNALLGFQIGAEMMFRNCRWAWGFDAKIGPYINLCDQTTTIDANATSGDARTAYHRTLTGDSSPAAMVGEFGIQATYKFKPNLMVHAGYDFMWITGLALGAEQLKFGPNPVNHIGASGTVLAQGVSLGVEWMW